MLGKRLSSRLCSSSAFRFLKSGQHHGREASSILIGSNNIITQQYGGKAIKFIPSSNQLFQTRAFHTSKLVSNNVESEQPKEVVFGEFELGEAKKEVIEAVFRLFSKHGDVDSAKLYLRSWHTQILPREEKLGLKKASVRTKYDMLIDCILYGYYGQSCKPDGQDRQLCVELLLESTKLYKELFLKRFKSSEYVKNALEHSPHGNNKLLAKIKERIAELIETDEAKKILAEKYGITNIADLSERILRVDFISSMCLAMIYFHDETLRNFELSESYVLRSMVSKPSDERSILMLATIYEYTGDIEMAEKCYLLLAQYNPNDPDVMGDIAVFYRNVKRDLLRAKQFFIDAIAAKPTHVNNLRNYAMYLFEEEGDVEEATKLLEQAMSIVPNDYMSMSSYGMVSMAQAVNDPKNSSAIFKRARDNLKRSLQLNPFQSCAILMNYAVSERMCGNNIDAKKAFDEAVKAYDEHEKIAPNDSHVNLFNNYASFLFEEGKYEEAKSMYQRALELDSDSLEVHSNLALTLVKLENFKLAETHFKKACNFDLSDEFHEFTAVKNSLYQYAKFSMNTLKNTTQAKELFEKLIQVCEHNGGRKYSDNTLYYEKYERFLKNQQQE
ncbi:TPR repeat protein [Naegleria gruberi]|uniref:TPR repeat protein n=1 Tax=Naegleria gruberi TaxID=5762 RepID=D2V511_NAEGR|nr:TPR repeat protein [Naegleria gruberi]EFC48199.1 TPR repeat protein [Naegleria gruberi]|eukprot:XP_002680943.1 TPR repeat protein [Naegleria gruberi strain NEG-M]